MARKLRLMLVDDRPVTELETQHLEIQQVPYREGELDPSLGTWAQHLRLWSENLFPSTEPDLVLIDCRFEEDYQYVPMSETLRGRDPRGLLHGAVFIARMFGRDRFHPFGFAVYSMDASSFANDAYAQTFMGFLLAMRDSTRAEGEVGEVKGRKDRELVESCSRVLGGIISQNPATSWGPALEMYRQRLAEVIDLQAIVVDKDAWLSAMDAVKRDDRTALDGGLPLAWRRFDGHKDVVELRSLFADCLEADRWSDKTTRAAGKWLEELLVLGDYLNDAVEWTKQVVQDGANPEELPVPRGRDVHGQRLTRFFHACAGVVAWYEDRRYGTGSLSSSKLVLALGLSDKQLNRYFKPLMDMPWGVVVDRLDEGYQTGVWPLAGQWELLNVLADWGKRVRQEEIPMAGP
ncbi:MAG: hypothetical protein KC910_05925 [Candidatus Eremiobacteraeota bacterium]|nr:hypothetical protein [Candidatus Eremiobacteraeota bacterium]